MRELPAFIAIQREYGKLGCQVLSISYDLFGEEGATRESVTPALEAFLAKTGVNFPVFVLDDDSPMQLEEHFDLPGGLPVTLALDKRGNIVDRENQAADKDRFVEMLERARQAK